MMFDSFGRQYWRTVVEPADYYGNAWEEVSQVLATPETANLIGSRLVDGNHAPALDIDLLTWLEPTPDKPGHSSLIVGIAMTRAAYDNLLGVMQDLGLISAEFCARASQDAPTATAEALMAPVIELTCPAVLVPSRTSGHFHLYLNHVISWEQYQQLLAALVEAGIMGRLFYERALKGGQTYLRLPGQHKAVAVLGRPRRPWFAKG